MPQVQFRNRLSRLLLKRHYERQTLTPRQFSLLQPPVWICDKLLPHSKINEISIERPIFIVGNARSGTTMVQDILCSHPIVAFFTNAMNEFPSCIRGADTLRRWFRLDFEGDRFQRDGVKIGAGTPSEGNDIWLSLLKPSPDVVPEVHEYRMTDLLDSQVEAINLAIRIAISCFGQPPRRFLNKIMKIRMLVSLLHDLYPDCRIIHLVRDPRQCVNSIVKMIRRADEHQQRMNAGKSTGRSAHATPEAQIREAALYWNSMFDFMGRFRQRANHLIEVRYEDIVAQPLKMLKRICDFCELEQPTGSDTGYWRRLGKIKPVASSIEYGNFDLIESICAEYMTEYGY